MMKKKILLVMIMSALCSVATAASTIKTVLPDSIQWMDAKALPLGAKVAVLSGNPKKKGLYVARLKLPANYIVPAHAHPGDEYDTVISGVYHVGAGNKVDKHNGISLASGSFVALPAKMQHYGWTEEETVLEISGTGPWGMIYPKQHAS